MRFPFGFGLSYTTFAKGEWTRDGDAYTQTITNTGDRAGAEVAQLFLDGELRGFEKVYLAPGESRIVRIVPEPEPDVDWSDDLAIPQDPSRLPLTTESRFSDLTQTAMGRILHRAIMSSVAGKLEKEAKRMPDGPERDAELKGALFMRRVLESNSLRSLSMNAGGQLPFNFAQGLAELANGNLIRAARCFLKKIQVPPLPKAQQKEAAR